jgi:hemolysin activation/secretion protein
MLRRLGFLIAAVWLLTPATARAQLKPTSTNSEYSDYEKEAIEIALKDLNFKVDPAPEGKSIGKITTVRLDILEPRDPGPELLQPIPILHPLGVYVTKPMLNKYLHITTKDFIVRREMLLKEGDTYEQITIDETARNMRSRMPQVSVVIIVPVQSTEPGKVDLLVLTKDIWSLRLSFNVVGTSNGIEDFLLVPQETNFLGLQHTISTSFRYQPETLAFGIGYNVPRFGYSWVGAGASAGIIFNRITSTPEGSSMGISVAKPLYSTRTEWAWDASAGYSVGVSRRYSNAQVLLFDSRFTPQRDNIPIEYKSRSFSGEASLTRSFGWAIKNNFTLSANAVTATYETFDLSKFDPRAAQSFRTNFLPTSEQRVYPQLSWHTFQNDYLRTLDITTLGLQEDYRLGHDISASVYPVLHDLGSSRDLIGVSGKIGYSAAIRDGFVGTAVSAFSENQISTAGDAAENGKTTDAAVSVALGIASPRLPFGRFVFNTSFTNRFQNYLNSRTAIGGSDRLRGYPTGFFSGKDTEYFNVEYRTRSVEFLKVQIGGVAFTDAGDAENGLAKLRLKQSVGAGIRILPPQINRDVFRLDFAVPLMRGPFPSSDTPTVIVAPYSIFFTFGQAFSP